MQKTTVIIVLTFFGFVAFSQKEANNWYFGERAGLTFERNNPVPLTDGQMIAAGAPAVVSDGETGQLLFYSNGENVWNRNHEVMPNGNNLAGTRNATNIAYAVPVPNSTHRFYLFTFIRANFSTLEGAKIYYSIIDISLNGGLGDIIPETKNTLLLEGATEKIAAIPHQNKTDYWLITHEFNSNRFIVYLITSTGITEHSAYAIGEKHEVEGGNIVQAQGHMKASPDGTKLAVTLRSFLSPKPFQLFDFNNATGEISNPQSLGDYTMQYGVSFSSDSRKLYLHGYHVTPETYDYLFQLDLNEPDILSSRTGLLGSNPFMDRYDFGAGFANFSFQLGPDGRLYGAGSPSSSDDQISRNSVFIIRNPNAKGYACDVSISKFDFGSGRVNTDLPNFIQSIFQNNSPEQNPNAPCIEKYFRIYPNPVQDLLIFEITQACVNNYSIQLYDTAGKQIKQLQVLDTHYELDTSDLASGLYILLIKSTSSVFATKIVKL